MMWILFGVWLFLRVIDYVLTKQDKKIHSLPDGIWGTAALAKTNPRPKDFVLDVLDIIIGIWLICITSSSFWILPLFSWVILVIGLLALALDLHRTTLPSKKSDFQDEGCQ